MRIIDLHPQNTKIEDIDEFGFFIGEDIRQERIPIPFYDHVDEGQNIPFEYKDRAVLRTARIHPSSKPVVWLERHMDMTQFFIGLGSTPFAMVLGPPTHELGNNKVDLPNIDSIKCFIFEPGTGILLKKGVWHDFPMAIKDPVTCITGNSKEVVDALIKMDSASEMNQGDIFKISLPDRLGVTINVEFEK